MARVVKSRPRRGTGLRGQAHSQAAAEYQPQVRQVRRETRGAVGSLRTMDSALQDSLGLARRELRHAGLQGDDLAMALRELAYRSADVTAGTQLNIQQARQSARGEVQDLLAGQGQAERSILGELQAARAERQQELADEERSRTNDLKDAITLEQAFKNLGLGSYADDAGGGLTPTQRRAQKSEGENARFHAKNFFDALRASGKVPEDPRDWDDEQWRQLVTATQTAEGVDDVSSAEHAVSAIRDHFSPQPLMESLTALAKGALPIGLAIAGDYASAQRRRRRK